MDKIDYTIGDEIVCIRTHPMNVVNEGNIYFCKGILPSDCKCNLYMVDVGIRNPNGINPGGAHCPNCKTNYEDDGIYWLNAARFKKLDTLVNISELLEVLEQPAFNNL